MPYRRPINIVVGRPIPVLQNAKPTQEYMDDIHALYVKELQRIWDDWRETFAPHCTNLEIVE